MSDPLLEPFLRAPESAGLFLDFDGTLSEIVPRPSEARPLPGAPELLGRLGRRLALVAVVSGRAAGELLEWLGSDVEIWGIHGAERAMKGRVELSDRAAPYEGLMRRVLDEARAAVATRGLEGVIVEDKRAMLTVHYRTASDHAAARDAVPRIAAELAARHGLTRAEGKLCYELRPPVEFSKREVVARRARDLDLQAAAFVGDDRVDLPAFDALDELAAGAVATLRVAVDSDEAPAELLERADVVVPGPAGVLEFLERLLGERPQGSVV